MSICPHNLTECRCVICNPGLVDKLFARIQKLEREVNKLQEKSRKNKRATSDVVIPLSDKS